jgi:hypothetical protein
MSDDPLDYTDAAAHLLECLDATTSDAVRLSLVKMALLEAHSNGMHHLTQEDAE